MGHESKITNVNLPDENGMTPLMHAVKPNDIDIVIQLLNADGEHPVDQRTKKRLPMNKIYELERDELVTSGVDVHAIDKSGFNSIHHMIELTKDLDELRVIYDNVHILELLIAVGADPKAANRNSKKIPLQMAEEVGAVLISEYLSSLFVTDKMSSSPPFCVAPLVDDGMDWNDGPGFNVVDDAQKMLRILEEEAEKKKIKSDGGDDVRDEEGKRPNGVSIGRDAEIYKDYTALTTKIDLSYGPHVFYNFY